MGPPSAGKPGAMGIARSVLLGAATGLRSSAGPAALAWTARPLAPVRHAR